MVERKYSALDIMEDMTKSFNQMSEDVTHLLEVSEDIENYNENLININTSLDIKSKQLKGKTNIAEFPKLVGEVDDTLRIQRAINSCGEKGRLYFGSDNNNFEYIISNTINIPFNDFSIFSDVKSEYGVAIKCSTPIINLFNIIGYGFRCDNIQFYGDVVFNTPSLIYTKGTNVCFNFDRNGNANIDSEITNCGFFGFNKASNIIGRNTLWDSNIFTACQYGIVVNGISGQETRGHRVVNNRFHSMGGGDLGVVNDDSWSILINDVNAFGLDISNNMVDFSKGFYKGSLSRTKIDGNNLYFQFGKSGIWITSTQADTFGASIKSNIISGNKNYGGNPNLIETLEYGIYFDSACRFVDVNDNAITHTRYDGIKFKAFVTSSNILNNKIINANFKSDVDGNNYNGITFDLDVNNTLIKNNHIESTSVNGQINHKYGIAFKGNASVCDIENYIVNSATSNYLYPSTTSSSLTTMRERKQYGGYDFIYLKNDASKQSISLSRFNTGNTKLDMGRLSVVPASLGVGVEKADLQLETMCNGTMKNVFTAFYDGNAGTPSALWNDSHLRLGSYHLWVDSIGKLRIKNTTPTSDTDGTIVGTQS